MLEAKPKSHLFSVNELKQSKTEQMRTTENENGRQGHDVSAEPDITQTGSRCQRQRKPQSALAKNPTVSLSPPPTPP